MHLEKVKYPVPCNSSFFTTVTVLQCLLTMAINIFSEIVFKNLHFRVS